MTTEHVSKTILCPACGQETCLEGNPFRPFCSRGCKGVDLIRWTSESYRIEGEPVQEEIHEQTDE